MNTNDEQHVNIKYAILFCCSSLWCILLARYYLT